MEKISVKEFVEKYNKRNSKEGKEAVVASVMNNRYVPIIEKTAMIKNGIDKSVVTDPSGFKYIDILSQKLNFYGVLLAMYTNLKISENDGSFFDVYDVLKESKTLGELISSIDKDEFDECMSINGNLIDSFVSQNYSNASIAGNIIHSASKKFTEFASSALNKIENMVSNEKFISSITEKMSSILK